MLVFVKTSQKMSDQLTAEQIAEIQETFTLFDKDQDGMITVGELLEAFHAAGQAVSEAEVEKMLKEADYDANGVIDFSDFLNLVANRINNEEENENDLHEIFRFYDLKHGGFIGASDIQFAMSRMGCKLTVEEADEMVREADLDGDGRLSYPEFRRIMMAHVS